MTKLPSYIVMRNSFYSQASCGISTNIFLLLFNILTIVFTHRFKHLDMTISHLSLIHILLLFTMIILVSSDLFGSQNIQNDVRYNCLFKQGAEGSLHLYNLLPEHAPGHHHQPQQFLLGKFQTYFSKSPPRILHLLMGSQPVCQ